MSLSGKRVQNASEEEEERYNDILIVMELLTGLLTKDFVDFGEEDNGKLEHVLDPTL